MNPTAPLRLLALVLFIIGSPAAWSDSRSTFKAGIARRDVTPREPLPMWGYGARHDALSVGALDALHATALVLEAGTNRLAIVGLDLGRSPREASLEKIRQRIKTEAGVDYSLIAGSHTHHAPVLELSDQDGKGRGKFDATLRYYQELEDAVVAAVAEGSQKLAPARMAVGSTRLEGFNRNRHSKIDPKPVDRELAVLRLDDAAGKPLALLVNFAAHPTMIPAATLKFSSDYIGSMRAGVEKDFGGMMVFMQGASGDLSVNQGTNAGYEAFGSALAREVVKLASSLETREVPQPSLRVREERFTFASRTDLSNPLTRAAYSVAFFPELVANYADDYVSGVRPRLTVVMLNGDIAIVAASGEFFCNHAIRLKGRARVRQLLFFGYCNGYHQYFPTIEAVAEGGYGADTAVAPAEVGAGERMMDAALIGVYQMQGKVK